MRFLIGLVVGAIIAAAIGAAAIAYAARDGELGHFIISDDDDRERGGDHKDSGDVITRKVDLRDFDRIDVRGVFELDVDVGGADFAIELSGHAKDLDRVEASVEDGELILDQKKREKGARRRGHDSVTATIRMPALVSIKASGVVDGDVKGVAASAFKAEISGVGDMELAGTCDTLTADVSGVGDLDAQALECKTVKVTVSGVGDASVYASEVVDATVSGMGEISVSGSPETVEKNGGMFSSINVK
jgi:hypothetical protein